MNGCLHGHICEVFGGSHTYLRCKPSLNSDLLKLKLYFFRGSTLINSMLLSVTLDFLPVFFLMSNFSYV